MLQGGVVGLYQVGGVEVVVQHPVGVEEEGGVEVQHRVGEEEVEAVGDLHLVGEGEEVEMGSQ